MRAVDGHSHGKIEAPVAPMDPDAWQDCSTYCEGIALFDHGYYWEAHEAWEQVWIAAGRQGAVGELLKGLIKLAAAGLKVRQGLGARAVAFGALAAKHFQRIRDSHARDQFAGFALEDLLAFAEYVRAEGDGLVGSPGPDVEVVFARRLSDESVEVVLRYHERTKHHTTRYAHSLGYMDWETQPDPFRRYGGAPRHRLDEVPPGPERYDAIFRAGAMPTRPIDRSAVSQLFYDSLALSAWKEAGQSRWALRVNPSSGNLHPTESYLLAPPIAGLCDHAALYHYAPHLHELEERVEIPRSVWSALMVGLPAGSALVGLTSIHWRESWKYGERALRYCQHDAGHALAAVALAASMLGWRTSLLDAVTDNEAAILMAIDEQRGVEAEVPDCLLLLCPSDGAADRGTARRWRPPFAALEAFARQTRHGVPNELSADHHEWPVIDAASQAATHDRPFAEDYWFDTGINVVSGPLAVARDLPARQVLRQRRSAVAMDGCTGLSRDAFYRILQQVIPSTASVPFAALPWRPSVHLALFVHRVDGLAPGLYFLVRDAEAHDRVRAALGADFRWSRPAGCPEDLPLYLLAEEDCTGIARLVSCGQDIAADGAFALGMIAEFSAPIRRYGARFWRRLHWETGVVGQVLYLEAEAAGVGSTGIGCFFDDAMHKTLGLVDRSFQTLYHFTVGGAVDDPRLRTLSAYTHRD